MKKTTTLGKPVQRVAKKEVYEKPVKMGEKGAIVKYIVHMLQEHGSSVKLTDTFHVGVRSAVVAFQKKNKLKPTGIVDKKTWDKLGK